MNSQESPTSVSFVIYYRGVSMTITHRDPSVPLQPLVEEELKRIDWFLDNKKALPSWNSETNKALTEPEQKKITDARPGTIHAETQSTNQSTDWMDQGEGVVCDQCGAKATMKSGVSQKNGKPWKGIFCSVDKKHVKWLRG